MKLINAINIYNKRVLIRVDFNVPIENDEILSDFRLVKTLKTIKYCLDKKSKIILMSHLGRPKGIEKKLSLYPVFKYLVKVFKTSNIFFSDNCISDEAFIKTNELKSCDIHLLENLRFHKEELNDDAEFSMQLAKHGDVYINDAFGTSHRKHSSNSSILKYFTYKGMGFLMEQELNYLSNLDLKLSNKMVLLLGGSKVSSKLSIIEYFLDKSNYILIGGAMSFTFLKALGYNVGQSLVENDMINIAKYILAKSSKNKAEIILPIDFICSNKNDDNCIFRALNDIEKNDIGFDIGEGTIKIFKDIISKTDLVIWNGPLGLFEQKSYSLGTNTVAKSISLLTSKKKISSIICGGDTASAITNLDMENDFTHISTGGGASLELLSGKKIQLLKSWELYE